MHPLRSNLFTIQSTKGFDEDGELSDDQLMSRKDCADISSTWSEHNEFDVDVYDFGLAKWKLEIKTKDELIDETYWSGYFFEVDADCELRQTAFATMTTPLLQINSRTMY